MQSAFVTTGQRCSCARRLIVPEGAFGNDLVDAVAALADRLIIGAWDETPEPYFGPLISDAAAAGAKAQVDALIASGARVIRPFTGIEGRSAAFVTPAILDVTGVDVPDEEIFAPVLQVSRVADFDAAMDAGQPHPLRPFRRPDQRRRRAVAALHAGKPRRRGQPQPPDHWRGGLDAVRRPGRQRQPPPQRLLRRRLLRLSVASFEAASAAGNTGALAGKVCGMTLREDHALSPAERALLEPVDARADPGAHAGLGGDQQRHRQS